MYDCNSGKVDNVSGLTGGAGSISGGRESYISSCSWDPGGTQLVVAEGGFGLSSVSIYDVASSSRPVVAQLGGHIDRVNCIAWHPTDTHCLTAAGRDGVILMHDVRCPRTPCRRLAGHTSEVCGLAYNSMGVLASGSNDNASVIWDQSHTTQPQFTLDLRHQAAVKALAWCPIQSNILATGAGSADGNIRVVNSSSGEVVSQRHVGAQVCSLLWSKRDAELLSGHGFSCAGGSGNHSSMNEMVLWRGSDLACIAELKGHSSRVLNMAQRL